jgi:hypothetical protein
MMMKIGAASALAPRDARPFVHAGNLMLFIRAVLRRSCY